MPSLLKASDLVTAHIVRGRLDAEGFQVDVVHENASQLWGGAVCGAPVLVAPGAAYPEIMETLASVDLVDPPPEADDGAEPGPAASPGVFGAALVGAALMALLALVDFVAHNLSEVIDIFMKNPAYFSYGGPIALILPDWSETACLIGGGAAMGAVVHLFNRSLEIPPIRWVLALLVLLFCTQFLSLVVIFVIALLGAIR